MNATVEFTLEEQILEIESEIRFREHIYPRWIESRHMSQAKADELLGRMNAVLATLRTLARQRIPA